MSEFYDEDREGKIDLREGIKDDNEEDIDEKKHTGRTREDAEKEQSADSGEEYAEMIPSDPHDYITDFEVILKKSKDSSLEDVEPVIAALYSLRTLMTTGLKRGDTEGNESIVDEVSKAYSLVDQACGKYIDGRNPWFPSGKKRLQVVKGLRDECIEETAKMKSAVNMFSDTLPEGATIGDIFEYRFREWEVAAQLKNENGENNSADNTNSPSQSNSIENRIEGEDQLFMQQVTQNMDDLMGGSIQRKYSNVEEVKGTLDTEYRQHNYSGQTTAQVNPEIEAFSYEELLQKNVNPETSKWTNGSFEEPLVFYSIYNYLTTGKFKEYGVRDFSYTAFEQDNKVSDINGAYLTNTPVLDPKGLNTKDAKMCAAFLKQDSKSSDVAKKIINNFTEAKEQMKDAAKERGILNEDFMQRRLEVLKEAFETSDKEFKDDAI
ncbi:MAG: hypothetical protein K6F00_06300 [Lachnospiraceae bacterium]|nr:hypothetical protein [Lachnospiraceae bacterium]